MASIAHRLSDSGGGEGGGGGGGGGSRMKAEMSPLQRTSSSRGSFRKILPPLPDLDQQLSMSSKMIDKRTSTKKGNHSYTPYFLEYTLLAEYNLLQKQMISGVYVLPSANSPLEWFGVLFIRQGLYQEGIFRFTVHIPENYPDGDVPGVVFALPPFHPLIDPETGELQLSQGFPKWRRNVNHLWHLLLYLRRIFYKIETTNPLNPEAAVLYENDHGLFERRVQACVAATKEKIYEGPSTGDAHSFVFSEYVPSVHDKVRQELKREKTNEDLLTMDNTNGLSFIAKGSMTPFSKPPS